jgi:methylated-DNA-[protein]-cysteine S-methyltransferase
VATSGGKLVGVSFGQRTKAAAVAWLNRRLAEQADHADGQSGDADLAADVLDRLVRYADGEPVDFSDVRVAVGHLTPFQQRVIRACRAIAWGGQRTYGDLADAAGAQGAARAVGQVMAGNRTPLVVPCHRVVAAGGGLGGFSAPDGLSMKRRLLALETGVADTAIPGRASGLGADRRAAARPVLAKIPVGV